ncbi:MAG: TPM domain-containing protein [Oxalicibacterium faecigallinarum]|uniref:TPM domain-containing protein n=1 Tax=Oxalicibacterium faecigallinarum TaxID=573741 RepID=UPI00280A3CF9|nr:TPM domain-containing protein [Oxalicibacterium faecigallinarum]MDQ7968661.1 TPM domain-containing protein [Oxalicibacterium faecigallinarum]
MTFFRHLLTGLLLCLCLSATAQHLDAGLAPVPPLQARVTDQIGMLNIGQRNALENTLAAYEQRTGNQIAILLVHSTAPETIEQYSIRVVDTWKLGRKGVDDGVLLLVAKGNAGAAGRLRIETGRGVQGVLTDAQSKRVLQDVIAPHFQQNDFYGGLAAGVAAITSLLDTETFAAPTRQAETRTGSTLVDALIPFVFFAFFFLIIMIRQRNGRRYPTHRQDDWGHAAGVILGSGIGMGQRHRGGGSFGGGFNGGGFSGRGGGFDGGGASGNW